MTDFELTGVQTESERLDASMCRAKVNGTIIEVDADTNIGKLCNSNKNKQVQLKISTFFKPKTTKKNKNRLSHAIYCTSRVLEQIKKKEKKNCTTRKPYWEFDNYPDGCSAPHE